MNKNLLKSFAAVALSLLAAGCAKEQVSPAGQSAAVSFTVDVPGGISTKAIGDGTTAKELWYQVFDKDGNVIEGLGKTKHEALLSERQTSVSIQLVKDQTYNIVFWAQAEGQTCYKFDDELGLGKITVNYAEAKANDESRDAFLAVENVTVTGPINKTVELKRPFSQLNIGTADAAIAAKAGVVVKTSKVEMKGLPNVLNTLDGTTYGAENVVFEDNSVPKETLTVNGEDYSYLAMNYILAPKDGKEISDVKATFTAEGKAPVTLSAFNVPFQRNYRTNIIGNILTNSADFNIIVVPGFEDEDKVYDLDNITTAGALKALFANGGTGKLTGDVEIGAFDVPAGKNVVLDLNGKTVTVKGNSTGHGSKIYGEVTIKGDGYYGDPTGESVGDMFDLYGSAVLNVEGNATFQSGLSCVQMSDNSSVNISGGKWIGGSYNNNYWTINKIDKDKATTTVNVTGGQFYKFNPAESHTENPVENWVADGYKSTLVGDYYVVTKEDVTPVADQAGLTAAFNEIKDVAAGSNVCIQLPAGEFTTYDNASLKDKDVTVSYVGAGADKTSFIVGTDNHVDGEANGDYSLDGVTKASFRNMTIKVNNDNYRGYIRVKELEFENCVFENRISYWGVGKVTFKNCTFNQTAEDYNLWTYSGKEFMFENCTFNSVGKFINVYKSQAISYKITVKDCKFISSKVYKSALELKANGEAKYEVYFAGTNTCTNINESTVTGSMLYNSNDETDSIVYIDGKKVWENGAKVE